MAKELQSYSLPPTLVSDVRTIIDNGRRQAYSAVSSAMVETYWHIGRRIVEEEQQGEQRAEYGTQLVEGLARQLTHDYGKGFSARYLRAFRKFYQLIPSIEIWKSRFPNLTWTHIFRTLRVDNEVAARWYLTTASQEIQPLALCFVPKRARILPVTPSSKATSNCLRQNTCLCSPLRKNSSARLKSKKHCSCYNAITNSNLRQ